MMLPAWRDVACKKTKATLAKIRPEWILSEAVLKEAASIRNITGPFIRTLLNEEEVIITEAPTTQLTRYIRTRRYSANEVALAYCKRAAFAHQLNNCLHEIFFEDAIDQAVKLDKQLEETGEFAGPMHGVPVSLKDQFHVKYAETTMGYVGWVDTFEGAKGSGREFHDESQLVEELHSVGAILYCKTSCPQTLLLGETVNNLIGRTMNPVNQLLSCGGSSGGEGALLALGASNVGVGTDIGGSVRIPAAFCGTCSIKPSWERFSYRTVANSSPGQSICPSAVGFMSTSLLGLKLIMTSLLSTKPWFRDPSVVPMPWREEKESTDDKLCFAVLRNDRMVQPHPPIARGIEMVVDAVKNSGHTVIEWEPPSHEEALDLHDIILDADGGDDVWRQLNILHEPVIPQVSERFGSGPKDPVPTLKLLDIVLKHKAYVARYLEYWASTIKYTGTGRAVDAVILPVAPHAAVVPGEYYHYGYTEFVNLLDFTSAVLPVTKVDKAIDVARGNFKPLTPNDEINWKAYNADTYDGAPVCVQLMGRKFEEEQILGIAMRVEELLKKVD